MGGSVGARQPSRRSAASPLLPQLRDLHALYETLAKAREARGAIDFETTETRIVCDANGRIEKIVPRRATTRTS